MPRFETAVKKKRFHVGGFSPAAMQEVSDGLLLDGIKPRLAKALDAYDSPAPPLKPSTAKGKARRGRPALRDWWKTGRTIRSMKTLEVAANRAVLGFTDSVTSLRAFFNNRRWRQFGVSPNDQVVLGRGLAAQKPVEIVNGN